MRRICFFPVFRFSPGVLAIGLSILWLSSGAAPAAEQAVEQVTVSPDEAFSNVFGGRDVTLNYAITSPDKFQGRLGWSLSIEQRTIARGEVAITAGAGRPGHTALRLRVPEVKKGAVVAARLSVDLYAGGGGRRVAGHQRRLWIFHEDPFALQTEWLEGLEIALFDPEGDTAERFEEAEIPFKQVHNVAALESTACGLLIIGEGVSLDEHRSLPGVMMRTAAGGVPVICLALSSGELPMPGTAGADLPVPARVVLGRQDAITTLDKRLDAAAWPPDGEVVAGTLSITSKRYQVVGEVGEAEDGWPWIEVRYPKPGATLLICGFSVVEHWDAGPAPRYLVARMLEHVAQRESETTPDAK